MMLVMKFQAVKGFEDYYAEDWAVHVAIARALEKTARSFGFVEVSAPAVESLACLTKKSG